MATHSNWGRVDPLPFNSLPLVSFDGHPYRVRDRQGCLCLSLVSTHLYGDEPENRYPPSHVPASKGRGKNEIIIWSRFPFFFSTHNNLIRRTGHIPARMSAVLWWGWIITQRPSSTITMLASRRTSTWRSEWDEDKLQSNRIISCLSLVLFWILVIYTFYTTASPSSHSVWNILPLSASLEDPLSSSDIRKHILCL